MSGSWAIKPIAEVAFIQEGPGIRKYEYEEGGFPMINVRCVQDGFIDMTSARAANRELANGKWKHFQIDAGDILFTISGTIGRCAIVREDDLPLLMNTSVVRFRPTIDALDRDYLYYFLQSDGFQEPLDEMASGTAIRNVGPTHIKQLRIPVPRLEEQKRIVAVLEEAFEGLARARAHTEANLQNARELFERQLAQYFSQSQCGWVRRRLGEITSKVGSGATPKGGAGAYKAEGVSLIRSLNVHDRRFKAKDLAFIDDDQAAKLSNVVVEKRDVLLNITGASVARCCVAPSEYLPARVNQHVSIIRPDQSILLPEFLAFLLTSQPYKDGLLKTGEDNGSTRQALTKALILDLTVAFPPDISQQMQAVSALSEAERKCRELAKFYTAKLKDLNDIRQSLLKKAFAGELT